MKVEELYCVAKTKVLISFAVTNKGADQLRSYCAFVFAYAKCLFSEDMAHIKTKLY